MTAYVLKREQYWKYKYKDWTQPVLAANGTLGGNSFAVKASSEYSYWPAWDAFDGKLTGDDGWSASSTSLPQHVIFYNPEPLKVSNIGIMNYYEKNGAFTAGNVYGSNDNSSWNLISSFTNDVLDMAATWNINLSNNKNLYKYHKIEFTQSSGFGSTHLPKCQHIFITAHTFDGSVKGTKDDYDFRSDKTYVLKRKRPTEYRKTVIDTATAGTYTFDVVKDNTTARIKLVGGGGGAGQVVSGVAEGSGGGSGAFIFCRIKLSAGTYTITNGAGGGLRTTGGVSKLSIGDITLLTANGGTGGANAGGAVGIGGTYEISEEANIEELYYVSNGNSGTRGGNMVTGYGGASLYNGYGRGGNTRNGGVAGYNWVELVTDETNYDTKFNRDVCFVLKRKQYWKYQYQDWTQPILTANGTIGEGSFAVSTKDVNSSYPAYKAFDGIRSDFGAIFTKTSGYLELYNPRLLKISSLSILNFAGDAYGIRSIKAGYIQASNNGSEYKTIKEFTNDVIGGGQSWNISLSDNDTGYKYYRIVATDTSYANSNASSQVVITELTITAQEQIAIKATKDDYDFTTN